MNQYNKQTLTTFGIIAAIIIIADQLTKYWISDNITFNGSETIIPGFLDLVHVTNSGVAFGAFSHHGNMLSRFALSGISLTALVVITWIIISQRLDRYSIIGFALFFGGAAGNFVDRVMFGQVTDFIDVHIGNLHWPAFNLADSALTIGAIIFCVRLIFPGRVET
ncbi:MAG: signal peptidase II [Desulfomonilaceae bacterium]